MSHQEFTRTYLTVANIAKLKGGKIMPSKTSPNVHLTYQQQDPKDNSNFAFTKVFACDSCETYPISAVENTYLTNVSPSGNFTLHFKDIQADPKKNRVAETRIEFWTKQKRVFTLGCKEVHGKVYTEAIIQNICWNSDETKVIYIAEKKEEDRKKWSDEIKKDVTPQYDFYEFKEDYGEQMSDKSSPRIFELDVGSQRINSFSSIPEYYAVMQPSYAPQGTVFVVQDTRKRRLGLRFCIQRESMLFHLDKELIRLAPNEWNVHCPRFAPDYSSLLYLTTGKASVHETTETIKIMSWPNTDEIKTVETDIPLFPDSTLPTRAYDGKYLVVETSYKTCALVAIVELDSGSVNLLTFEKDESSFLLDQYGDYLLINVQSPVLPFKIFLCKIKNGKIENQTLIDQDQEAQQLFKDVSWSVYTMDAIDYVVVVPKTEKTIPMILNPHGGPHGCSTTLFRMETLCFVMHGYGVITVNYRGSTGYSKEFVECLPGHVGDWDVKDCLNALEHYISRFNVDRNQLYYLGGSHGGFIGGHMIGQYPSLFKAAILHNPVINMAVMVTTTDIPDWCFTEVGFDPYENEIVTVDFQEKAFKMSPIYHVEKVKTPTFLLIGDSDLRVPPEQGVQFFHALKKLGTDVKMNVYKDQGHPISDPQVSLDRVVTSLLWFGKYK